jgi:transcriptional regulator with XRE-family HTH domain
MRSAPSRSSNADPPPETVEGGLEAAPEGGHGGLLAANLRRLRQQARLSLSQVARNAGISKATLSALEAGRGNPTMTTLVNLAMVLGATPSDLLAHRADDALRVVRAGEPVSLEGPVVSVQFLDRVAEAGEVAALSQMLVPHTETPQHSPGHPGVEHLIVRQGWLRIGPEGEEVDVGPGDYVTFDGGRPHSYWAPQEPVHVTYLLTYHGAGRGYV